LSQFPFPSFLSHKAVYHPFFLRHITRKEPFEHWFSLHLFSFPQSTKCEHGLFLFFFWQCWGLDSGPGDCKCSTFWATSPVLHFSFLDVILTPGLRCPDIHLLSLHSHYFIRLFSYRASALLLVFLWLSGDWIFEICFITWTYHF
jgi:hypothetical protein